MKNARLKITGIVLAALAVLLVPGMAMALGTAANTDVTNSAYVQYTVGASPTVYDTSGTPATATFKVDEKVIFTVTNQDGAFKTVVAGQTGAYLTYVVQNNSNAAMSFDLTAFVQAGVPVAAGMGAAQIYIDTSGDGLYGAGDTLYDTATMRLDLAVDTPETVFVVADVPPAAANSSTDDYYLVAQATDSFALGGAAKANTGAADVSGTSETQLADADSTATGGDLIAVATNDAAGNGYFSDKGTFSVGSAIVTVNKAIVGTVWSEVAFNNNPKAIPSAYVEYELTIANDALATASAYLTQIVDTLPATIVQGDYLDTGLATATPTSGTGNNIAVKNCTTNEALPADKRACDTATQLFTDDVATIDMTVLMPAEGNRTAGQLAPGDTVKIYYMVVVQ